MSEPTVLLRGATYAVPTEIDRALEALVPMREAVEAVPDAGGPGWGAWPAADIRVHVSTKATGGGHRILRIGSDRKAVINAVDRMAAHGTQVSTKLAFRRTKPEDMHAHWTIDVDHGETRTGEASRIATAATIRGILDQSIRIMRAGRAQHLSEIQTGAGRLAEALLPAFAARLVTAEDGRWSLTIIPTPNGMIVKCDTPSNAIFSRSKIMVLQPEVLPTDALTAAPVVLGVNVEDRKVSIAEWSRMLRLSGADVSPVVLARLLRDPALAACAESILNHEWPQ